MVFTNNVVLILIILFYALYFILFETKLADKLHYNRNKFIAVFSIFFYATWYPPAILLLIYHTLLGLWAGKKLEKSRNKVYLWFIILFALVPLLFFKYFNFFIDLFGLKSLNIEMILPLGLSFYTFSMIGYYIDIYHKHIRASRSFVELLLFIAFWPHLAAGPILRAKNIFSNAFKKEKLTKNIVTLAVVLIAVGLVKKLLIADNIGAYVNWNISYGVSQMNIIEAWATILGFSAQIYADFSGYSDMAIGFAMLMGFKLPANFNYPYRATTMTEFWHRWHISLSTWFRDYVYYTLGGSRVNKFRVYFNILIVFVLSGIWHGAGIGFVIWGALHGLILIIEKALGQYYLRIFAILRWIVTFVLIIITWSFFRLEFGDAVLLIKKMFGFQNSLFLNIESPYYVVVIMFLLFFPLLDHILQFYKVNNNGHIVLNTNIITLIVLSLLLFFALTFSGAPLPFIYFVF